MTPSMGDPTHELPRRCLARVDGSTVEAWEVPDEWDDEDRPIHWRRLKLAWRPEHLRRLRDYPSVLG